MVSNTSVSVKPNAVAYSSSNIEHTLRLFMSEKNDSLLILVIPVSIALDRYGLLLNVTLNSSRIYFVHSASRLPDHASSTGVSYSSNRITTFFLVALYRSSDKTCSPCTAIPSVISPR